MRIAIPSEENGMESKISMHFGRCRYYAFVDIEDGKIKNVEFVETPFKEHGYSDIPNFVKNRGANLVIVYGIGERAIEYFNEIGVDVIAGVNGKISDIVSRFMEGKLNIDLNWKSHGDFRKHEH